MKARLFLPVMAGLLASVAVLSEAEASQFRSRQNFSGNWNSTSAWQIYQGSSTGWVNTSSIPGSGDEVFIMSRVTVPSGPPITCWRLWNGVNHLRNVQYSNYRYYPTYRHVLTIKGTLNVTCDTYITSDTLHVDGGTFNCRGALYVGYSVYYSTGSSLLDKRRRSKPTLKMSGGTLNVTYTSSTSATAQHSGGVIFLAGADEQINAGNLHVHGWLGGAYDAGSSRYFDLSNSSANIFLDGSSYPATWAAQVYVTDNGGGSHTMKFSSLSINRPGGRQIMFGSWLEIYQNLVVSSGYLTASNTISLSFEGNLPGMWETTGNTSYTNIMPTMNNKNAQLTLYSTVQVPGFSVNNSNNAFSLFIDNRGAIVGGGAPPPAVDRLQILDGRVWISTGSLEVRGFFQVGQGGSSASPVFDILNAGRLFVSGIHGVAQHGDFFFYPNASGSLNAGIIEVEGEFFVDNSSFALGGSNTLITSGNVGKTVRMWNNRPPSGYTNATLVINNFIVKKTLGSPGNQVDVISDLVINGDLAIQSGVLNGVTGWTVYLYGQWPTNPPLGSGQGFTGGTALEIKTPGRFVLPGGQGPVIRINKSDTTPPTDADLVELGGNMSCYGIQIWDGRFEFKGFSLQVTGDFIVGSGNPTLDQTAQPQMDMVAGTGGGSLDIDATGTGNGSFVIYNYAVTHIDSGLIDVEGDFKIDSSTFLPTGSNVIRLTGNRGKETQIWSNKPTTGAMLTLQNFMFMKTGSDAGSRAEMGSAIEVLGTFTMISGQFNASLAQPFNSTQVLHLKGAPNAWAGTGGSYTNTHNNGSPPFQVLVDGTGDQTCWTGVISAPDVPPDITILKTPHASGDKVDTAGSVLHGSQVFIADGTVDVASGGLIAETDLYVGGTQNNSANAPRIKMDDLNGLIEVRRDFYFMTGSIEEITDGLIRVHGDMRITDNHPSAPLFDLYDLGTERTAVELIGSASGTAEVFRANSLNQSIPLNLYDLTVNKDASTDRVEVYSDINVNGSFLVLKGTVATPGGVINIRGNWSTSTGGMYDPTANLALNGTGNQQVISSQATLPNVRVDKPQSTVPGPNVAILPPGGQLFTQNFWVRQGTFRLNGGTMTVTGDFVVGGNPVPIASKPVLEITQATGGGNLIIQHQTGSTGTGNFYFNGGNNETAVIDSGLIRCTGRFAVGENTFSTSGTNTVELSGNRGSRGEIWNASGTLHLANLVINKSGTIPGNQVDAISSLLLDGNFTMIQGVLNTNNFPRIEVGGNWSVASGALFIPTVSTTTFTGAAGVPVTLNVESDTAPFYNLEVKLPNGSDTIWYVSSNGRTLQVNRELDVVRGVLDIPQGITLDVASAAAAGKLKIGDATDPTADGTLTLHDGASIVMANNAQLLVEGSTTGTLQLQGAPGSPASVTSSNPGTARYDFRVGGTLEARHYAVLSPTLNGLEISDGASVGSDPDALSQGTFGYPAGGGTLLNLSGLSSSTILPLTIRECAFLNPDSVSAPHNVKGGSGWTPGTDTVYFLSSTGNLAGENFDDDPGDSTGQDGYLRWMVGTVDVALGPATPDTRSVLRTAGAVVAMQIHLQETSGTQAVDLQTITVSETGPTTGNISSADLYRDVDHDGQLTSGTDSLLASGTYSGGPPATVTFGTAGTTLINLTAGMTVDLILVYNLSTSTPSPSDFQASITSRTAVTGEVSAGGFDLPAEVTGTFPVTGNVMTVRDRGTLTVEAGPTNPPTGQIIQGMTDGSMQQIRLTAGTEEDVQIHRMDFELTGGNGATASMLYNVRLYEDANEDGYYTSGETLIGTVASWSGTPWTASFTGTPLMTVSAGQSRTLLLVCQVLADTAPGGPAGGETFKTAIPAVSDIEARGVLSYPVISDTIPPSGTFPLEGNTQTITLQPSILAMAGTNNPPSRGIDKAWSDVPMIQARLVGLGEDILVSSITFTNSGSCDPTLTISGATLVRDDDGNGTPDTGEPVLATATSVGANLTFTWPSGSEPVLQSNRPVNWLLCYDFNGNGTNATSMTTSIPMGGITGTGVTTAISGVNGLPFAGGTVTLLEGVGTLNVTTGLHQPVATFISRSAVDQEMFQVNLSAGPNESLKIMEVTIHGSGTGDESTDVLQVSLYKDADGDGKRSSVDSLLGTGAFAADDGTVTFTGTGGTPLLVLDANASVDLLVTYTLAGTASHKDAFRVDLDSAGDVVSEGSVSLALINATGSFPQQGPSMEVIIPGTLTIAPGSRNPQQTFEIIGSEGLTMLQFSLSPNENEDVEITRVTIHASGSGHDVYNVVPGSVRLLRDVDRNGILSEPDEEIEPTGYDQYPDFPMGWGSFGSDDGVVVFHHLEEVLTAQTTQFWIVVLDLEDTAPLGSTYALDIQANAEVEATGLKSKESAFVTGAPVVGGQKTLVAFGAGGSLSLFQGLNTPPPRNELSTAQEVEVLQVSAVASTVEDIRIKSITLSHRGTGDAMQDISQVRLYRDLSGNGLLDMDDVYLGAGSYDASGEVTFPFAQDEIVKANTEVNYLAVYDLSGNAPDGANFICGIQQNAHIVAEGVTSYAAINVGGAPVDGSALVVGTTGSLIVSYGPNNPGTHYVSESTGGVRMMHLAARATSPEGILIKSVSFHAGGTGDDADTVTVTLMADLNGDGRVNGGDYILGVMNQTYDKDNGTVTFENVDYEVRASETAYMIVLYNFTVDPNLHWGDTYELRMIPSLDVSCEGLISLNVLYSAGSMLFSDRAKIGYPPGYEKYLNLPGGSSGGGCFIATASFGDRDAAQVRTLTAFRDRVLAETAPGRWFIRTYYRLSPPVADFIREKPLARWAVRQTLAPLTGYAAVLTAGDARLPLVALALVATLLLAVFVLARRSLRMARR